MPPVIKDSPAPTVALHGIFAVLPQSVDRNFMVAGAVDPVVVRRPVRRVDQKRLADDLVFVARATASH